MPCLNRVLFLLSDIPKLSKSLIIAFNSFGSIIAFTNIIQLLFYEILKPLYEDKSTNGKYIWTYQGSIDQNKWIITVNQFLENREPDPEDDSKPEVFYFDENVYRWEYDGKKYEDKCEYFPIPKEVKIIK